MEIQSIPEQASAANAERHDWDAMLLRGQAHARAWGRAEAAVPRALDAACQQRREATRSTAHDH